MNSRAVIDQTLQEIIDLTGFLRTFWASDAICGYLWMNMLPFFVGMAALSSL